MNARLLGKDRQPISDHDFDNLTKTAYHEGRHAEQQYLVARARATSGERPASFASDMLMNGPAAQAAAQDPLPLLGTEYVVPPAAVQHRLPERHRPPVADPAPDATWADARGECAARWDDSMYGSGQAPREALLADLRTNKPRAVNRAAEALDRAKQERADKQPLAALDRAWRTAGAEYEATQRAYAAPSEEADAFATEALLHLP